LKIVSPFLLEKRLMLKRAPLFALLLISGFTNFSFAQDENTEDPPVAQSTGNIIIASRSQDENGGTFENIQIMGAADFGAGGGTFMISPSFAGAGADPWSIVNMPQIQDELDLVDSQKQQLQDLQKEFSEQMSKNMQSFTKDGFSKEHAKAMRDVIAEMQETMKSKMGDILLPHQMDRLNQVSVQMEMKNRGDAKALMGKRIAEALGIDDEQKKRIEDRSKEIEQKLKAKIEKLKEEAREELMGELSSTQRKKLKDLMGDRFEMKPFNFREQAEKMRKPLEKENDR
jgi:hypothetical protein